MADSKSIITNLEFFKGVSVEKAVGLLSSARKLELLSGEVLFDENEKFPYFCILIEGEINLSLSEHKITKLKAPQVIGEFGLINKVFRRSLKAECNTDCIFLKAEYREISEKLELDPILKNKILLNLGKIISKKLKSNNLKLLNLKNSSPENGNSNEEEDFCPHSENHLANQLNDRAYIFFPGIKGYGSIVDKGDNYIVFLRHNIADLPRKRCMATVHIGSKYFVFTAKVLNPSGVRIKVRILNAASDLLISLNQVEF